MSKISKLKEITLEEVKQKKYEVVNITENYFRKGKDLTLRNKETNSFERYFISRTELLKKVK